MKKGINVAGAPGAIGPYAQGNVASDGTVYLSGQVPLVPETKELITEIKAATHQVFSNIKNILAAEGLELDDIVKTTVLLADLADFQAVNEVYATYFTQPYPARSCFQVGALPLGAPLEIECIAKK